MWRIRTDEDSDVRTKRIPSREGGVEIVVEELSTRMAMAGHDVTCYNRRGHHVSGSEYDTKEKKNIRMLESNLFLR